ncbi:MAG: hypoxanthine phosphoribosyltransferase [Syntrophobacteraceae bacterium]
MQDYELAPRLTQEELESLVDALALRINQDYEGKSLILIGILKGAFIFLADLARRITLPVEVDFVRLTSYGKSDVTSGVVRITKDIEMPIEGQHVLIVEDIVDTGITLAWYLERLKARGPESVRVCALIDKYDKRQVEVPLDYVGIRTESGFLVGYGLDFAEKHRNLRGIYEVQFLKSR